MSWWTFINKGCRQWLKTLMRQEEKELSQSMPSRRRGAFTVREASGVSSRRTIVNKLQRVHLPPFLLFASTSMEALPFERSSLLGIFYAIRCRSQFCVLDFSAFVRAFQRSLWLRVLGGSPVHATPSDTLACKCPPLVTICHRSQAWISLIDIGLVPL